MDHLTYFNYLRQRSGLGLIYRRLWLYPLLCRYLAGLALDVGCGIGDMLQFRKNSIGVDINPYNIDWCRKKGLKAYLMENNQLPFEDGAFRSALVDNVLEHIIEPKDLLNEIHRVLTKKGRLIVGVPGRQGYAKDTDHKVFYDESLLMEKLSSARFSLIKMLYTPFRSSLMEKRMPQYCLYGVFEKA